jgi:hypothetical protein
LCSRLAAQAFAVCFDVVYRVRPCASGERDAASALRVTPLHRTCQSRKTPAVHVTPALNVMIQLLRRPRAAPSAPLPMAAIRNSSQSLLFHTGSLTPRRTC